MHLSTRGSKFMVRSRSLRRYFSSVGVSEQAAKEAKREEMKKQVQFKKLTQWDFMVRGEVNDVRVTALRCTNAVKRAQERWNMEPLAAIEWGEFTAATLLNASLQDGEERIIAQINCEGSRHHGIYSEAIALGEVRGYTKAKDVSKETEVDQKGLLLIQKILYRAAKPYTSMTPYEGDLTEAWRQYYEMSEQIPTFLHIEADPNSAFVGGILVQSLAPPSSLREDKEGDETKPERNKMTRGDRGLEQINDLKNRFASGSVPSLESISTTKGLVEYMRVALKHKKLKDGEVDMKPVDYYCRCKKDQYVSKLATIGADHVHEMINDGGGCQLTCHFCNETYDIEHSELEDIAAEIKRQEAADAGLEAMMAATKGPTTDTE